MNLRKLLITLLLALNCIYIQKASAQCPTSSTPSSYYYSNYWTINAFTFASVASNNPGTVSSCYNSFSTPVRNLTIGSTYAFTASVGLYSSTFAIWIDLDNNGQYDVSEMVVSLPSSYTTTKTGNITIPNTATPATNVRMRVRSACSYYQQFTGGAACTSYFGNYGYGETEDYYVNLISPCLGPVITQQPTNQLTCPNGQATFTTTATSAATYKWQVSSDGGVTFIDVTDNAIYSGSVTNTLTLNNTPYSYNNYQYQCKTTSGCGTPTLTNAVLLNMHTPVSIATQTSNIHTCDRSTRSLNITIGAGIVTNYRWQIGTLTNGYTDIPAGYPYAGVNTTQLDISPITSALNGLSYRCIAEGPCSSDTSADIPMEVIIGPIVAEAPKDDTIQPYNNASFNVVTTGLDYLLFWQASADGGTSFVNINNNSLYFGSNTNMLYVNSVPPNLTGMKFRCILKSTNQQCGIYYDTSSAGTLYVGHFGGLSVKGANDKNNSLTIYPNPAAGSEIFLNMKNPVNADMHVSIIDKLGKVVYTAKANLAKGNSPLPVGALSSGVYSVKLSDMDDNLVQTVQFTKQ